jgi:predicted ribonuclease YlaK
MDRIFEERFVISSKSLEEIENIKESQNKSEELKYKARCISRLLNANPDKYEVAIIYQYNYDILNKFCLPVTNDNLILSSAWYWNKEKEPIVFVTNDNNCRVIADKIFNLDVEYKDEDCEKENEYKGYKLITLDNLGFDNFYSKVNQNIYNNEINEYLVIANEENEIKDRRKWNGKEYAPIKFKSFKSKIFGDIRPLDGIQMCAFDSISNNEITLLYGKAGSGKTTLPLAYIMQGLETEKFKKCYIIHHYETLKKAKTLGYEAGSHEIKLLNSGSLGNILSSKFSDYKYITSLLGDKIEIIPTANIRGAEFGEDSVVFVTECQNIDPYTLKTIIQRCKAGCKQIYEGDMLEQSDINMSVSGMKRMLEVFKGYSNFGCVKLRNNYRSDICELADKM